MKFLLAFAFLTAACSSTAGSDDSGGSSNSGGQAGGSNSAAGSNSVAGLNSVAGSNSAGGANSTGGQAAGGSSQAGGSAAGGAGTATPTKCGQVTFAQYFEPSLQALNASFVNAVGATSGPSCDRMTAAGCISSICDPAPSAGSIPSTAPTAGTITFTSTDIVGSATVSPDASGAYGMASIQFASNFKGSEHAMFKATGAQVPAFEQEVDMPLLLLVSEPAAAMLGTVVPRASDFDLKWARGAPGVSVYLTASSERVDGKPGTSALYCTIPSEPGTVTIPAALLQRLKPDTMVNAYTVHEVGIQSGEYSVLLAIASDLRNAANDASINFVLQ